MFLLLTILIDAVVLIVLLKVISDDEIDIAPAAAIAFVFTIGTFVTGLILVSILQWIGFFLTLLLAMFGLAVAVSALFGVEIKRSLLIGLLYVVAHTAVRFGIQALLSA